MYLIEELVLDIDSETKYIAYENPSDTELKLRGLSKLNIFIGTNNSGKSRFVRKIINQKKLNVKLNCDLATKTNQLIDDLSIVFLKHRASTNLDLISFFNKLDSLKLDYFSNSDDVMSPIFKFITEHKNAGISERNNNFVQRTGDFRYVTAMSESVEKFEKLEFDLKETLNGISSVIKINKIYIPVLRGLRTFDNQKTDYYQIRTSKDYFENAKDNVIDIFTGQKMYEKVTDLLLGNLEDREIITNFQDFLSKTFFENKPVALIPKNKDDVLHIKIGDEKEYPIYQLGDGIQSIIIITFPLFYNRAKNKSEIFFMIIEEPELFLHPGLQRKLIETLCGDEFENFQYFITTHSNHFLDLANELDNVKIYKVKKQLEEGESKTKSSTFSVSRFEQDDRNLLNELGVKNSSVFLSNCTILVEGISDIFYLRKYLEMYQANNPEKKQFIEDNHYSFLEYNGTNIVHWSFLGGEINAKKVTGDLFIIADNDGYLNEAEFTQIEKGIDVSFGTEEKKERLINLLKQTDFEKYVLRCREIENLITPEILKKAVLFRENSLKIKMTDTPVFLESEYKDKYLGEYIDSKLASLSLKPHKYSKTKGDTIWNKLEFAKIVTGQIQSFDDLSVEAKKLIDLIYTFISKRNS